MKIKKKIISLYYLFQLLQSYNKSPRAYWIIYVITIFQTFFTLQANNNPIMFSSSKKIVSPQSIISQSIIFGYLIITLCIQLMGLAILPNYTKSGNINKNNTINICMKIMFWISFANYTINIGLINGFQNEDYKISAVVLYSLLYLINIMIVNNTLGSKRIWYINQLLVYDILRLVLLWVNGNKILIAISLILYLLVSVGIIFLRPIFQLSNKNNKVYLLISKTIYLPFLILIKLFSKQNQPTDQRNNQMNISGYLIQLIFTCLFVVFIYTILKKWLQYNINKLVKSQNEQTQTNIKYDINHLLLLQYLQQNADQYKSEIKLYILQHVRKCKSKSKCQCTNILKTFITHNNQNTQNTQTNYNILNTNNNNFINNNKKTQKFNQKITQSAQTNKQTNNQDKQTNKQNNQLTNLKQLFSDFVLFIFNQFLQKQLSFDQYSYQNQFNQLKNKQITNLQKSNLHKNYLILQFIKLQKLITTSLNLNQAYFQLKSLQHQLKTYNLLSYQTIGKLQHLKYQIVQKKQINMQIDTKYTNKFCIKYFNCQKINNKLQQLIMKSINEIKQFWKQVKIKQPDQTKLLNYMFKFNKYHNQILLIYEEISKEKQKQSIEIKMMFRFYQKILEMEGENKFFKSTQVFEAKSNHIKNAKSLNLKLYSEQSTTHIISFSINQQNFGQIKYKSSGLNSLINQNFINLNNFLPSQYINFHTSKIKQFLYTDYNYYQHTLINPCYIKITDQIIKPVYLQTHIMSFINLGEIQLITFIKPLIQDQKLINKGTCRNFDNIIEENVVLCVDDTGRIINSTKNFQLDKQRMFQNLQIQQILNSSLIHQLQQFTTKKIQLADSDYQLSIIKKIPIFNQSQTYCQKKFLYFILFQNIIQKTIFQQQQQRRQQKQSSNSQQQKVKHKKQINLKNLLIKTLDNQLQQVQKYDQIKDKINRVWHIVSKPEKHNFKNKWLTFIVIFLIVFSAFIVATTYFMYNRKTQFKSFHDFLSDFTQNQLSTVQAITYLRQMNIYSFFNNKQRMAIFPQIIQQVSRLNVLMYQFILKLSVYYTDIWKCIDILDYGARVMRSQRAYIVLNNFVLNSVTNIVHNLKKNSTSLNFSPIQSQIKPLYNQVQSNYLKLVTNTLSFVLPSQFQLRQKTLTNVFIPKINDIYGKPFFYIPIIGLGVCIILLIYFFNMKSKLQKLNISTFKMFQKIKVNFAQNKINYIQQNIKLIQNHQILSSNSLSRSKKVAWKNVSNLFQKTSTLAFGTFVGNTVNSHHSIQPESNITNVINKNSPNKLSINSTNQVHINEQTQRQLYNDMNLSSRQGQKSINQSFNQKKQSNQQQKQNQINNSRHKKSSQSLQFGRQQFLKQTKCQKIKFCWVIFPVVFYFTHIFLICIQFNQFMQSILMLQNKLLYRRQALTYDRNYQYQLGLFQGFIPFADNIIVGLNSRYKTEEQVEIYSLQTQQYLFGRLENYNKASSIFVYDNICQNLDLLQKPQPTFTNNFTKQQCQTIFDGVLKNGYHQSVVQLIQSMRSLVLQNMSPQFYPPIKRFQYLNDSRIESYNKLYPYVLLVAKYIQDGFQKDFGYFIQIYQLFILLDTPIMILLTFSSIFVYIRGQRRKISRQVAMIKCCFLLIGHKNFLKDTTLLKDEQTQDQGKRYYFLY